MFQNSFYGYRLVAAAFLAQFIGMGIFSYVHGPFMMPMIQELGWTRMDYSITRGLGMAVTAVCGIFIGSKIDRVGARPVMLIGGTILALSCVLHAFVDSLVSWWLLNGVMMSVGCAMVGNLVVNVTLSKWFVVNRGMAVSIAAMGVSFGGIALTPWVTWLIDTVGWRMSWVWIGVAAAVLIYPVALAMRRMPEDYGLFPDGYSEEQVNAGAGDRALEEFSSSFSRSAALRTLSFYALVIAFGFFTINIGVMLLHTVPYLTDNGFTSYQAALTMAVVSLPAMISKPFWGYFIDRSPAKPLAAVSAFVTGVALFLIVYAVGQQELLWVFAAYVLLGLGWGGMIPLQEVIWASFFGRRFLGSIRGAAMPFSLILGASAPPLVGYFHDVSGRYDEALIVVAGLNVLSGFLIFFAPEPKGKPLETG